MKRSTYHENIDRAHARIDREHEPVRIVVCRVPETLLSIDDSVSALAAACYDDTLFAMVIRIYTEFVIDRLEHSLPECVIGTAWGKQSTANGWRRSGFSATFGCVGVDGDLPSEDYPTIEAAVEAGVEAANGVIND